MSCRELKWSLFRDLRNKLVAGLLCTSENITTYWWVNGMTPKERVYLSRTVLPLLWDPIPKMLVRHCAQAPAPHSPSKERGGEMLCHRQTVCRPSEGQGPRRGPLRPPRWVEAQGPSKWCLSLRRSPCSRLAPSGTIWHQVQASAPWVPEQLEMVAATGEALRLKRSVGGNVLLLSGGSFPCTWKPCCPLPIQRFCHLSVPSPYFTVLGSLLQSWPGFLLSHEWW